MRRFFETVIDSVTMYRVVLYGLYLMIATAWVLSAIGQLPFTPLELVISLAILVTVSYLTNKLFGLVFRSGYNPESWQITALIIVFLIFPQTDLKGYLFTALIAFLAMASKYLLAIRGHHIFNPAAVAVVASSALGLLGATWWIATVVMLPVVIIVGVLVVWKLRHFAMVFAFGISSVLVAGVVTYTSSFDIGDAMRALLFSSPLIFAGTIMLTEPLTSPTTKKAQVIYGILVGTLSSLQLGWLSKPDVALLIGNAFSFLVGQRRAIKLTFVSSIEIAPMIYSITLKPVRPIRFTAGQYIELTLPHAHADYRGIRRMFSIASQPGDEHMTLGLVTAQPSSSFKTALIGLAPGTQIRATQVGGSFVLPKKSNRPIVMIAGGIGITPFRSMIAWLLTRMDKRQVTLFYGAKHESSLVYGGLLNQARETLGTKVVPIISEPTDTWAGAKGMISYDFMQQYIDNMSGCLFYISGPNAMVSAVRRQLLSEGVPEYRIKTDYFSGY